jgi:hypothetical protein
MAVVQISRIQQRRGKKNTNTGLPQLASGELAWCVDTQELFIGNGSVAEGAPFVGNTRLLTENEDILNLVGKYQFGKNTSYIQTGATSNQPITQSLQDVLDQTITLNGFGATGNGQTDDTAAIQRAIDQLFLNPTTQGLPEVRVKLNILPGEYIITETLYIPSYANIQGAGKEKTIFRFQNAGTMVQFTDDLSTPEARSVLGEDTTELNQARYINISGITFATTAADQKGWQMDAVRDSTFTNIAIEGAWEFPEDSIMTPYVDSKGIELNAWTELVTSKRNTFTDVEVSGFAYVGWSDLDIDSNKFINCYFHHAYKGFSLGFAADLDNPGQEYGPRNVLIQDSYFFMIYQHGIIVYNGSNNVANGNRFVNVGNGNLGNEFANYAHIDFQTTGNLATNTISDRTSELEIDDGYPDTPYVPVVNGYARHDAPFIRQVAVNAQPSYLLLFRLPVPIRKQQIVRGFSVIGYEIMYQYRSTTLALSRFGTIYVHADIANNQIQISDEYEYTGDPAKDLNLEFKAEFINTDGSAGIDTLGIYYRNATINDTALLCYSYRASSFNQTT